MPRLNRGHPPLDAVSTTRWAVEEAVPHRPLYRQFAFAAPRKPAPATVVALATAGKHREAIMAKIKVHGSRRHALDCYLQ